MEHFEWDIFICHASEDKDDLVRPLFRELKAAGLEPWYDDELLRPGVGLRQAIDEGLARSRLALVVLSPAFFRRGWPNWELDGLVTRQIRDGRVVIVPVWHRVGASEVASYSLPLANMVALRSSNGIDELVRKIVSLVRDPPRAPRPGGRRAEQPGQRSAEDRLALAGELFRSGNFADAMLILQDLTHCGDPEVETRAWFALGAVREKVGDGVGARQCYERAAWSEHEPDTAARAAASLGRLLESTEPASAIVAYRRGVELDQPGASDICALNLGVVLMQQGDAPGAEDAYRRAAEARDADTVGKAANNMGLLLREQGRIEEAAAWFRAALECGDPEQAAMSDVNLGSLHAWRHDTGPPLARPDDLSRAREHWERAAHSPYPGPAASARFNLRKLDLG